MMKKAYLVVILNFVVLLCAQTKITIIDDGWVRLTVLDNRFAQYPYPTDFIIEILALDRSMPVEVSYLIMDGNGTPRQPSTSFVMKSSNFDPPWDGSCFFKTEVGGWGQAEFAANPKYLPLPHYRTCLLLLARYEKIYAVFLRENDGQVGYTLLKGGSFSNFEIPNVARIELQANEFVVTSLGQPVEVGMWVEGRYTHDEVGGWAAANYAARTKRYKVPHYEMFMMMLGRYDKLALIIGKENDGRLGVIVFPKSASWSNPIEMSGFCRTVAQGTRLTVTTLSNSPVEITHFAFDNTSWQWEVGGWALVEYAPKQQTFTLKHYTPGLIVVNRYQTMGLFGYNENDGRTGVIQIK